MDHKMKLWIKYFIGAVVTGLGAGYMLTTSYDIGRANGVEAGATTIVDAMNKAYGEEKTEEICEKLHAVIKNN